MERYGGAQAPALPLTTTQSSSGSLPPADTATTHGVAPPTGTATRTGAADASGTTITTSTSGRSTTTSSGDSTSPGSSTHTTNGVTAPEIGHGNLIPENTTHPEHIDLARRRAENLGIVADKRDLTEHEQDIRNNALRVLDRNTPAQPGDRNNPLPQGTRDTGNPDHLAMAGDEDALVSVTPDGEDATLDAEAVPPHPSTPARPANALGTTVNGPSTANSDAPTASAGTPTPPPPTGPTNTSGYASLFEI